MRYLEKYNVSRETYEEVRRNPGFFFAQRGQVAEWIMNVV